MLLFLVTRGNEFIKKHFVIAFSIFEMCSHLLYFVLIFDILLALDICEYIWEFNSWTESTHL